MVPGEDDKVPAGLEKASLRLLGSIEATVYRAAKLTLVPTTGNQEARWKLPDTVDSIPEKVLKGADIHATTRYFRAPQ
jgi:hypothetical protein